MGMWVSAVATGSLVSTRDLRVRSPNERSSFVLCMAMALLDDLSMLGLGMRFDMVYTIIMFHAKIFIVCNLLCCTVFPGL
jgi:hypothetical protein